MEPSRNRGELRFQFGENWSRFLATLTQERIATAERSLAGFLGLDDLTGKSFLDVGSGSGLFSLAARRLGATVHSFDYDPQSIACTLELRQRFYPGDPEWAIEQGSALDREFLQRLGTFDIVYAWGVLHHTGRMWEALANMCPLVVPRGLLYLAVYNDEGLSSRMWRLVKRVYCRTPRGLKFLVLAPAAVRLWGPTIVKDSLRGQPLRTWREYHAERGMSAWHDIVDWVGGYPFEVARPVEITAFFAERGFALQKQLLRTGRGCNEFLLQRTESAWHPQA